MSDYFNFRLHTAVSRWERRTFVKYSQQIYESDFRWTPPDARVIHRALDPTQNQHLARLNPKLLYFEGLRRAKERSLGGTPALARFEAPLATGILLQDPRRPDRTAYLARLHCVNSQGAFLAFQDKIVEELTNRGIRRLLGPVGISPHLENGALTSHWQLPPPLHTAYNPPYLPEILARRMQPIAESILFTFNVPTSQPKPALFSARLDPLDPAQLSTILRPLLAAACENPVDFAPPDEPEIKFWQSWLGPQLHGWVAWVEEQPVGFVLLVPDWAERLRQFHGGRGLWRLVLTAVQNRPVRSGRILFGGVLPAWRERGIGQQLWQQTVLTAQKSGWQRITIGPVWRQSAAVPFLQRQKAIPQQTYQLYERTF